MPDTNRDDTLSVVISEVTDMKNDRVCVAGFCERLAQMVRPLRGRWHWPSSLAHQGMLSVGSELELKVSPEEVSRTNPHAREDRPFLETPRFRRRHSKEALMKLLKPTLKPSVEAIFGPSMIDERYVIAGSPCASLGAVEVEARKLGFSDGGHGLRCWFHDRAGRCYNFGVTSRTLRHLYREGGFSALNSIRLKARRAHLRLGLANPWAGSHGDFSPLRCYIQVNGIIFQ